MSILETRYRQLLAWFPRDDRDVHEEEMLGVLMADARPGQQRPDPRDAVNLIAGALHLRLRRAFKAGTSGWQDAIPVSAVIGALLTMLWSIGPAFSYVLAATRPIASIHPIQLAIMLATIAVVIAAALNGRWLAASLAWGVALFPIGATVVASVAIPDLPYYAALNAQSFLAILTAVLLTFARRPKRGFTLLGKPSIAGVVLVGLALAWSFPATSLVSETLEPFVEGLPLLLALPIAAGLVRSTAGRRVVLLLFVPPMVLLTPTIARDLETQPSGVLLVLFLVALLAVLAGRYLRVSRSST